MNKIKDVINALNRVASVAMVETRDINTTVKNTIDRLMNVVCQMQESAATSTKVPDLRFTLIDCLRDIDHEVYMLNKASDKLSELDVMTTATAFDGCVADMETGEIILDTGDQKSCENGAPIDNHTWVLHWGLAFEERLGLHARFGSADECQKALDNELVYWENCNEGYPYYSDTHYTIDRQKYGAKVTDDKGKIVAQYTIDFAMKC